MVDIVERTWTERDPRLWAALGRVGARVPAYASLHHVIPIPAAERFLDHLLREKWESVATAARAALDLGRFTGDRARDLAPRVRLEAAKRLEALPDKAEWGRALREVVLPTDDDRRAMLGEDLPVGLVLNVLTEPRFPKPIAKSEPTFAHKHRFARPQVQSFSEKKRTSSLGALSCAPHHVACRSREGEARAEEDSPMSDENAKEPTDTAGNRRAFLKGAGIASVAALSGALAGCDDKKKKSSSSEETTKTAEVDAGPPASTKITWKMQTAGDAGTVGFAVFEKFA